MLSRRLVAALLVGAMTLTGCTSMKTIRPATPGELPFGPVQTGDTVVVHTRGGEQASFVVQRIDAETLVAEDGRRYVRSDILRLERKAFSGPKTTGLIAGIAGGVFVVVSIAVGLWLRENSR
jgi:hypothetical protein